LAQAKWIAGRMARVLPIQYFHVVFTLPAELRGVAKHNRQAVFDLLFAAASATLLDLGRDPKYLGAELGITTVLHTWARDLSFHPHVHAIVTGGGLSLDAAQWEKARRDYLFPLDVMGALFRNKLLAALDAAIAHGELVMPGGEAADPQAWDILRDRLYRIRWIVYAKRPFGGAEQVIRYLGRYTHRVGISNQRLVSTHRPAAASSLHPTGRLRDRARACRCPGTFRARSRNRLLIVRFERGHAIAY
jgi:hypothetical protein